MKCEKCGSNLKIDDEKCPYCGTPNKVAIKHRMDMKKYASDYTKTRAEVLVNSKRFNKKNMIITLIAITVAFSAVLAALYFYRYNIKRSLDISKTNMHMDEIISDLNEYMENQDYFGLYTYVSSKGIRFSYGSEIYDYMHAYSVSNSMMDMFNLFIRIETGDYQELRNYDVVNVKDTYNRVHKYMGEDYEYLSENEKIFIENAAKDVDSALKIYLGFTDDELKEFAQMSDAQKTVITEEKMKVKIDEKTSED